MIIRSGIVGGHQTLPEKEADVLLRTLVNNIERKYGPEVVAKMDQLGTPQLPRQDACRLVLVVYKEALALPSQYRAKVIRHLLAAG